MHRIEGFLFFLGISLFPVYVFPSGGAQPAHIILALFALIVVFRSGVVATNWAILLIGLSFYVFLVEAFYSSTTGNSGALENALFICFNSVVTISTFLYCRKSEGVALTCGVVLASAIAVGVVSMSGFDLSATAGPRSTGSFNNPNQLGYFSVCILSLSYLLYRRGAISYFMAVIMFGAAVFLSIASLSKAAMLANFVVVFIALKPAISRASMFFWALLSAVVVYVLFAYYQAGIFDDVRFVNRLQNMAIENDSSLEARGYNAVLAGSDLQVIFGLGDYNVRGIVGHEVHSTLISVLANYGVIGFLLFGSMLVIWAKRLIGSFGFTGMVCLTAPVMLYGLTHNGTRFTIFWILLGATFAAASVIRDKNINEQKIHGAKVARVSLDARLN